METSCYTRKPSTLEDKAKITFEHDRRLETFPFARNAVREAVYNAIIHNCYMYGAPIQIRIEDEAMIISNSCIFRRDGP